MLLVTFEILSHYAIDSSYSLQEDFQWITDKVIAEKLWFQMASTFYSRTSLPNFWFLPDFVVVFIVIRLIKLVEISY